MNPTAARSALQSPISVPARIAGGVAALAIVAAALSFAGEASREAVDIAYAGIHPAIVYVTLPTVEVHAFRQAGEPMAEAACANPHSRT